MVWAHGEDQAGPHGGYIQMPGAFHTEVVSTGKDSLKIYLLDMEWKNPSVKKSSLKVTIGKTKATCKAQENFYHCVFPATIDLFKKGELKVIAQREGQSGAAAIYPLPLSF